MKRLFTWFIVPLILVTGALVAQQTTNVVQVGGVAQTTIAKETTLASVKTNTDPLVASGAGGYFRQDSNATVAKENGGNLAGAKTDLDTLAGGVSGGRYKMAYGDGTTVTSADGQGTPGSWLSNNSDTEIIIKASAGVLTSLTVTNSLAAVMYVRAYNLTNPDCTSATGILQRWIVPVSATGAGANLDVGTFGQTYSTGISLCVTTTIGDTNNTAIASNVAAVSYSYR